MNKVMIYIYYWEAVLGGNGRIHQRGNWILVVFIIVEFSFLPIFLIEIHNETLNRKLEKLLLKKKIE